MDNETVWFAFRPKTLRDSLKKKKKLAISEFALMGCGVYILKVELKAVSKTFMFFTVLEKSCDDCSNRSHSYNCRETKGR